MKEQCNHLSTRFSKCHVWSRYMNSIGSDRLQRRGENAIRTRGHCGEEENQECSEGEELHVERPWVFLYRKCILKDWKLYIISTTSGSTLWSFRIQCRCKIFFDEGGYPYGTMEYIYVADRLPWALSRDRVFHDRFDWSTGTRTSGPNRHGLDRGLSSAKMGYSCNQ